MSPTAEDAFAETPEFRFRGLRPLVDHAFIVPNRVEPVGHGRSVRVACGHLVSGELARAVLAGSRVRVVRASMPADDRILERRVLA